MGMNRISLYTSSVQPFDSVITLMDYELQRRETMLHKYTKFTDEDQCYINILKQQNFIYINKSWNILRSFSR
jgi:hypothetical protein